MEALVAMPLTSPQKRVRDHDDGEPCTPTPHSSVTLTASTPLTVPSSVATPSPLRQATIKPSSPSDSSHLAADHLIAPAQSASTSGLQPAKRRKLTEEEKEEQRLEKEARAKAKAEKKTLKEVEDKLKAEQKAQKDEERRKKTEEKEQKKRARELKQQQEEEDKRRKERSQMRLNVFFTKPKTTIETLGDIAVDFVQDVPSCPASLTAPSVTKGADPTLQSPQKNIMRHADSDYGRYFLPFSLPPHAVLAPSNALLNHEDLVAARTRLDRLIARQDVEKEHISIESLRSGFPKRRRGIGMKSITEIVSHLNGSASRPIDLTENHDEEPLGSLKKIPMKYLHFSEDVRPPYYGTYTKIHAPEKERKLARNPTCRGLSDLNYDYDSEAEWEEPEEGEDLDSENEDDLEEEGDEDMDGFLDDEDDPHVKRRHLNGDQEPVSTGLCWEDTHGISRLNDGSGAISTEFKEYRIGFLLDAQPRSIDPFSTAYWVSEASHVQMASQVTIGGGQFTGTMNPPRLPLTSRPVNGLLNTISSTQDALAGTAAKAAKPKRMISADQMAAFKAEIQGQDLTKIGMIEALKKKFPKVPKDAITNTLTAVAKRVGPSEKEKRWILLN